jgi:hypothetical protein
MPASRAPIGALVLYPPRARQDQALYRVHSHHEDGMAAQDKDNTRHWLVVHNDFPVAVVVRGMRTRTFTGTSNTSNSWTFG